MDSKLAIMHLGYWGPVLLLIITPVGLGIYNNAFMIYYVVFYVVGFVMNCIIKKLIKQPRPKNQRYLYHFERNKNLNNMSGQNYGMPSSHVQICFYSLFTTLFIVRNYYFTLISLIITLATCYQRYIYKNHTILQIMIGSILGIVCFTFSNSVFELDNKRRLIKM